MRGCASITWLIWAALPAGCFLPLRWCPAGLAPIRFPGAAAYRCGMVVGILVLFGFYLTKLPVSVQGRRMANDAKIPLASTPHGLSFPSPRIGSMPQTLANSLTPERAIEAAEKLGIFDEVCGKRPFAAKADADSAGFLWGLKPPSPSGSSFSAACRARIDSAAFMPGRKSRHTARTSISAACIGLKCFVNRQWVAPVPLRLWHLASLDAPTVAVVWTLGFAWAASVRLPPWIPVLLALATWAVYVADRLSGCAAVPAHRRIP